MAGAGGGAGAALVVAALLGPATSLSPFYSTDDCPLVVLTEECNGEREGRLCFSGPPEAEVVINTTHGALSLFWSVTSRLSNRDDDSPPSTPDLPEEPPPTSSFHPNHTVNLTSRFLHLYPVDEWKAKWFTDDYFQLVNPHWFDFPPPPRRYHLMFAGLYALLTVTSFTGNFLVIFMISNCRSLRTPSNLLVLNLAVSDLMMLSKGPIFIYNSLHFGPALGIAGCQLYGFLGGLCGTASIMTLAAIALDRYFVIANPLDPSLKSTRIVWIVLIWTYSAVFAGLPVVGRNLGIKPYVPEGYLTSCSFDYLDWSFSNKVFVLSFFVAAWVFPFCIISLSYVGICRQVLRVGMARRGQEKEKRKRELRLAVVVIFVVAIWFLSWTPYAVVALLGITGNKDLITPFYSMVPAVFCKTSACIDPFVYSLSHPRMRVELFKLVCRKRYDIARANTQKTIWKTEGSINAKFSRTKGGIYGSVCSISKYNEVGRDSECVDLQNIRIELA
ncbi:hypothetical protein GE061_016280 [Apolygus lucorum]|uniref:G-protein coupled receptors family 1 profile domain-containing protein n=1 Tax=Apolygus lucorum TaxID=248454 RepID=A0A8S9XHS0_APOLU|nr:hypothetical protein GE061_016280 [Apolygus lucorum]